MLKTVKLKKENILRALESVQDDPRGDNIVALGMVAGVQITGADVLFTLVVDPERGPSMEPLRQQAENAVSVLPGVKSVRAVLTAERKPAPAADPHGMDKNPKLDLPVKNIIAVASGKGGVGKSTVAFNLAVALARAGQSVGVMDADIYGPSAPLLAGLPYQKPDFDAQEKIIPFEAHGVKVMSMGFLAEPETPMIWRGPMVQTAVYQLLRDVAWGTADRPLDVLVIDMPPGTGDAQLTLAQKVRVDGAVIVSTPQDLALIDARKAVAMFEKVGVPVLGVIENMSTYVCPSCGHHDHIFGHGGAREEAERIGVPFLGEIPLNAAIRQAADSGQPVVDDVFTRIAQALDYKPR